MEYSLVYDDGLFIGETSGDAVVETFGDLMDAMLDHDEWKPGASWLHDHTNLNADPLTAENVQGIADLCKERRERIGSGKCAIVVTADLEYGLGRMWATYVEDKWEAVTGVFRSRDEAMAWFSEE